ncbi:MAG: hypothetical protein RMY36_028450 [Nostoc sp. SerVER01]|nr:hypothetical protein [Nostoc sp. SerVER01]MDZ8029410.1 hypothetical protein [Nostoc sp. DedQUE11]MDZ8079721.1 hypothetical protein [Nostoc sp. DcaGUA01]
MESQSQTLVTSFISPTRSRVFVPRRSPGIRKEVSRGRRLKPLPQVMKRLYYICPLVP